MKLNLETAWPVYIGHSVAEDLELERQYLIDKLESLKLSNHPSVSGVNGNTTQNGYQPDYNVFVDWNKLEIQSVYYKLIEPLSQQYWNKFKKMSSDIPENCKMIHKAWLVRYENGSYQNLHMHRSSLFTGIWTLECEDQKEGAGELHLHNPTTSSYTLGFYSPVKKIKSSKNDVYIIPAWLGHNVTPTTNSRIVFVWDSMVVPE